MNPKHNDSNVVEELQSISQIIYGEPASKANSRRVVRIGGISRLIKSKKALTYSDVFRQQCKPLATMMTGDLKITLHIWYASRRPDLDESLILDLLQGVIYANDRQVKERHCYWHLDPDNPRTFFYIEKMEEVAPKKKPRKAQTLQGELLQQEREP